MTRPPCKDCSDRRVGCHALTICLKWAAYQEARMTEMNNLPTKNEREDMREYIANRRKRYLKKMDSKKRH